MMRLHSPCCAPQEVAEAMLRLGPSTLMEVVRYMAAHRASLQLSTTIASNVAATAPPVTMGRVRGAARCARPSQARSCQSWTTLARRHHLSLRAVSEATPPHRRNPNATPLRFRRTAATLPSHCRHTVAVPPLHIGPPLPPPLPDIARTRVRGSVAREPSPPPSRLRQRGPRAGVQRLTPHAPPASLAVLPPIAVACPPPRARPPTLTPSSWRRCRRRSPRRRLWEQPRWPRPPPPGCSSWRSHAPPP